MPINRHKIPINMKILYKLPNLGMFRFVLAFVLSFTMGKPHKYGTFPNCGARLILGQGLMMRILTSRICPNFKYIYNKIPNNLP
jgi:hypothetical protein